MKVFILQPNYIIQGSENQTSPHPSQRRSYVRHRKSKTSGAVVVSSPKNKRLSPLLLLLYKKG